MNMVIEFVFWGDPQTFTRAQLKLAIGSPCSLAHMKLEHCSLPQEKDRVDSIGGTPQTSSLKIKKCSKSARKPAPKLPFESTFLFSIGQKIGQKLKKKNRDFFLASNSSQDSGNHNDSDSAPNP